MCSKKLPPVPKFRTLQIRLDSSTQNLCTCTCTNTQKSADSTLKWTEVGGTHKCKWLVLSSARVATHEYWGLQVKIFFDSNTQHYDDNFECDDDDDDDGDVDIPKRLCSTLAFTRAPLI